MTNTVTNNMTNTQAARRALTLAANPHIHGGT